MHSSISQADLLSRGYSGLTAYNHNLDTSREFYPKVSDIAFRNPFAEWFIEGHHHSLL